MRGRRGFARTLLVAAGACAGAVLLAGCAQGGSAITITYEADGSTVKESFTPKDIACVPGGGAFGLQFADEPFYQLSVSEGEPGQIEVGLFDEKSVLYFESDSADVRSTTADDGSVEYVVSAKSDSVALVDLAGVEPGADPDLSGVPKHSGSIEATFRCLPDA
ncbi:hypothetical protein GCM10020360_16900 [Nonlabens tegetincola]